MSNKLSGQDALRQLVVDYDVVSFDFFDTLFIRPIYDPEDAFDILAHRHGISNFKELRREAQTEAFRQMHVAGRKEITLENIYEVFPECSVPAETLKNAEYELELDLVSPNPELVDFYKDMIYAGKTVIVVSDMYLDKAFFVKALNKFNLPEVALFISADENATKRDYGELYDVVATALAVDKKQILHIGDNQASDVEQAKAKGVTAYHYQQTCLLPAFTAHTLPSSLAVGLGRTCYLDFSSSIWRECGFFYAGPASLGFLRWVEERVVKDKVDHVLNVSRDGFLMQRISEQLKTRFSDRSTYFFGSRIAFTLAAITEDNFCEFLPFILSGSDGLSPFELLERIGVQTPDPEVMKSLGLADDKRITPDLEPDLQRFLYAYRWEILKVCRMNRRALFNYLNELGVREGQKLALVDVGWSGSTQEALELALKHLMDVEVVGYYFCLVDTPERIARSQCHDMKAMFSSETNPPDLIAQIYNHRVTIETLFSAPHHTVIGFDMRADKVHPVEDCGRGAEDSSLENAREVALGGELFAQEYTRLLSMLELEFNPCDIVWPIVEFAVNGKWSDLAEFRKVTNFDTWASSRNKQMVLEDYL